MHTTIHMLQYGQLFSNANQPTTYVFGLEQETGGTRGNPQSTGAIIFFSAKKKYELANQSTLIGQKMSYHLYQSIDKHNMLKPLTHKQF